MANRRLWVAVFALLSAMTLNACGTRTDSESHFDQELLTCRLDADCPKGSCVSGLCVEFPPVSASAAGGSTSEPEMNGLSPDSEVQPADQEEPLSPNPSDGLETVPWTKWEFWGVSRNRFGVLERYVLGPNPGFTWRSGRGDSICKNELPACAPGVICVEQLRQVLSNEDVVAAREGQSWGIDYLAGLGSPASEFEEHFFQITIEQNGFLKTLGIGPDCRRQGSDDGAPCAEVPAGLAELRRQFTALAKQQVQLGECADIPSYVPPGVSAGVGDAGPN